MTGSALSRRIGTEVRKGTKIPYLAHLLAVSSIVLENGGTEDQAIGARLHDAGEDHGGRARIADIRSKFGDTVADIVEACSDDLPGDGEAKRPWHDRKHEYIERLRSESPELVLVSAADKLHNARSILTDYLRISEALWSRFNAGRDDTLWYYNELCGVIEKRLPESAVAKELRATVDSLNAAVVG